MTELEEKQANCPYCHEPFTPLYSETDSIYGLIMHKVFEVCTTDERLSKLKYSYCPICGRKLGD
ncbi:hypothetical protein [Lactobacillus acetotolerans]|uniref:hypothetical protein n=1 Tax=Lactobacillus acetotolerans TaxID=1600 RepID=UPI002FD88368